MKTLQLMELIDKGQTLLVKTSEYPDIDTVIGYNVLHVDSINGSKEIEFIFNKQPNMIEYTHYHDGQSLLQSDLTCIFPQIVTMKTLEEKVIELTQLADGFMFPEFYSHTGKDMWKVKNLYTKYKEEKLVLDPVENGFEKSLDIAIEELTKRKEMFFNGENVGY